MITFEMLHADVARSEITPELGASLFGYPLQDRRVAQCAPRWSRSIFA